MDVFYRETGIGTIGLSESEGKIVRLYLPGEPDSPEASSRKATITIRNAFRQIEEYLAGKRKEFELELEPKGTPFMQTVWEELRKIPYGKTASYRTIAEFIGRPKAFRAVGLANNRNPIPIFIPCHRVIGSDGSLVGFRTGLEMKKNLLNLEGVLLE